MRPTKSTSRWEVLDYFPSAAVVALGDRGLLKGRDSMPLSLPSLRLRRSGYGMLYGLAETDGLPVELGHQGDNVVAARLEFTDDIADLERRGEGQWKELGTLRIGSRGAVAVTWDGGLWTVELPLPVGDYRAEKFSTVDDDVGIRLVLV